MKPFSRSSVARAALAAAAALLAGQLGAQGAADVAGEWDVTLNSPQGSTQAQLTLKREGDNWTGIWKSTRGERPLQNVTVKGNDIRFESKVSLQGQEAVFIYTGTLDKGAAAIKGSADFGGFATGDWSAVRRAAGAAAPGGAPAAATGTAPPAAPASATPAASVDISGSWLFTVDTGAGSGQPAFTFKQDGQKLTGTYAGAFGQANLTGTLNGTEVKFSFTADAGGQSAEITYTGKVLTKDSMQGTVNLGGLGEGTWSGKRQ